MNRNLYLLASLLLMSASVLQAQEISIIKYKDLSRMIQKQNDTTYVFNFWATWCRPCVKELPHFEALSKHFEGKKIKVMLISLDFKSQLKSRLLPFARENKLESDLFLLDEPDYNSWINKISDAWEGSIPATLVINNQHGIRQFYEKEFTEKELVDILQKIVE